MHLVAIRRSNAVLVAFVILTSAQYFNRSNDYSQYVDVFIGSEGPVPETTAGGGDVWVGAAVPFGAVKFGLDITAADGSNSFLNGGWAPDGNVTAVSALHVHGTGGGAKYGVIPQMPLTSLNGVNLLDNTTYSQPRIGHDTGSVGYFSSHLANGVHLELSATQHTGLMQYTFPSGEKHIVVDISHYLPQRWKSGIGTFSAKCNLYFMHLMPSDRAGENLLWYTTEPWWDDFYTLWDLFRCTTPLWHLLQPARYEGMIRALIEMYRRQGYMPDGRSGNFNGETQGGSNADNVLADAYVKGLRGGINWTDGYAAMLKDAEVVPFADFPPTGGRGSSAQGRAGLANWKQLGYLAADQDDAALSRSVEYSANDFALSQVARGEAPDDVEKYMNRSAGWQRVWANNVTSLNFTGFLTPRLADGSFNFTAYDPLASSSYTTEGTPWEYSFTVAHDMQSLITKMGGPSRFERRLDTMFTPNPPGLADLGVNAAGTDTIMNIGNEPDFAVPHLYNYINKSWKSVNATRYLAETKFNTSKNGLPGNSDAGALNSWLIWQMLGLWPVTGQPVYLLGAPRFNDITISVGTNNNTWLRGQAPNLSRENRWVNGVKTNGESWPKNWFEHTDIMVNGGTIEFAMGPQPIVWETSDAPASPGHVVVED